MLSAALPATIYVHMLARTKLLSMRELLLISDTVVGSVDQSTAST